MESVPHIPLNTVEDLNDIVPLKEGYELADPCLRDAIIKEAISWLGTPYHHMASVKGAGVDCLTLIIACYRAVGIVQDLDVPFYRKDFMLHKEGEDYIAGLLQYSREVETPYKADVALYKWGRVFAHSAIVVRWPDKVIHASPSHGVSWYHGSQGFMGGRPIKFVSAFKQSM